MNKNTKYLQLGKVYILILLSLAGFSFALRAQQQVLVSELHPELRYYPLKGEVYYSDYMQVKGSPFLEGEEWMIGDLILASGESLNNIKFKLDIFAHRILVYQEYLKRIVLLGKDDICEFYLGDTSRLRKFVFLEDISSKAKVSGGCYFEVLSEGKISFYKLYSKDIIQLRSPQMPYLDEFLDEKSYFLKDGEKVTSFRLGRNVLFKLYPEYKQEMKQFIRRKDLQLKGEDDFAIAVSHLSRVLFLVENNQ